MGILFTNQLAELAYNVSFAVQDPHNQGFTLRLDGELRCVLRAVAPYPATANAELASFRTSVLPAFEPASIKLPDLTKPPAQPSALVFSADNEFSVNQSGRSPAGHWRGTRSFKLIVESRTGHGTAEDLRGCRLVVGATQACQAQPACALNEAVVHPRSTQIGHRRDPSPPGSTAA